MTIFREESVLGRINFLRKGDKFLLVARSSLGAGSLSSRVETRTGVIDMDGHAVSTEYGWSQGNHYYDDLDYAYINARFDDANYSKCASNTSLYARPARTARAYGDKMSALGRNANFLLLVEPDIYDRVFRDCLKKPEQLHPSLIKVPEPTPEAKEISLIEAEMAKLQARLEAIRAKV